MVTRLLKMGQWLRAHHLTFVARITDYLLVRGFYGCDVQSSTKMGGVMFDHNGLGVVVHPKTA